MTTKIAAMSFNFSYATVGVRFNFSATTHALRPSAEPGYVHQTGKVDQVLNQNDTRDNPLFKGGALHVGTGLTYFVALPVTITLAGNCRLVLNSPSPSTDPQPPIPIEPT